MKEFLGKNADKSLAIPSRLQNRKHHINSLVRSAADTELALLDARGGRSRTKAETQAKYGW